jgi:hypothetical protein
MPRETDFAQAGSDRALQAATMGMNWARQFAEESFNQGKRTFDGLFRVARKMAEDWESQAATVREQTTVLTEKAFSNAMEFGQKLANAKEPQEFAECQSEYLARQAQTFADGTKEFGERMQQVTRNLASNASRVMAEASRRGEEAVSRAEQQTSRRQQRAEV